MDTSGWAVMARDSVRSVVVTNPPPSDRERDLDTIRSAYDGYRVHGRRRLWDLQNPGFARLVADRDRMIISNIRASLGPSVGRLLEIGFGDARLAEAAHAAQLPIGKWAGVDLDADAVRLASQQLPWATFIEASADRLPFDDATWDVVLASALFSSLPSIEIERAVAAETARVLAPGGWLVWYDLRIDNPTNRAVHGLSRERLRSLFPGWKAELRAMSLLPPLARRLGRTTPIAYPILERVPMLRSHLGGRLQSPPSRA